VEVYRQAGVTPDKLPAKRTTKEPMRRLTKPTPIPANEVIERVAKLYQEILNPALTPDHIDQELQLLDGLKKADLLKVAERIDVKATVQKMKLDLMRQAIKKAIRDRRGMFHRPTY
jgi:hypothetical protein